MTAPQAEAVIDLDAFRANIAALKACAPESALMTVVKADGYGHGVAQMARAARQAGSEWLGVATLDEALALRRMGDTGDVLCWLAAPGADFAAPIDSRHRGHRVVGRAARRDHRGTGVRTPEGPAQGRHRPLAQRCAGGAVDGAGRCGRGRPGRRPASRSPVSGRTSPAPTSRSTRPTTRQEAAFGEAVDELTAAGIEPALRHLSNSAATLTRPSAHLDLVRVGIAAYGIRPDPRHDVRDAS